MNKYLIILLTFCLLASCVEEKEDVVKPSDLGTWKKLGEFPGEGRSNAISFSLSGKGYFGTGTNNETPFLGDIWAYDPATDTWTQKSDIPMYPTEIALSIGDKAYVLTYSGGLYEYSPGPDSWRYLSQFPAPQRTGVTGFVLNGKAYFGTGVKVDGNTITPQKDFWRYDPADNSWIRIKDFPGAARVDAIAFVIGDRAYVGLGFDGEAAPPIYTDMWSYNATTDSWSQIAEFPEANSLVGITFSNNTNAYVGVPENNDQHIGEMYEYSPATDAWRKVNSFPSGSSLQTHSFTIGERMFVVGGWYTDYSREVWEFIP